MKIFYHIAVGAANKIDRAFGLSIKEKGGRVYRLLLKRMSPMCRIIDPVLIRLWYKIYGRQKIPMLKLHLGCGWKRFDGYVNVDLWITDATDVICDISKLPWPDHSAVMIESYHVIEHISHRKIDRTLADWYRVLMPGGRMIIECPDFDQAVREYLQGNEARIINIFGRQRSTGDAHLFGYNLFRLKKILQNAGFRDLQEEEPQSSQSIKEPSLRIVCRKLE